MNMCTEELAKRACMCAHAFVWRASARERAVHGWAAPLIQVSRLALVVFLHEPLDDLVPTDLLPEPAALQQHLLAFGMGFVAFGGVGLRDTSA